MKYRCPVKRNAYYGVKCIWVPKGTITNTQGPNKCYQKLRNFFCRDQRKRKINGTWTVVVQGT